MERPTYHYKKRQYTCEQDYDLKLIIHFLIRGLIAKKNGDIDCFFVGVNVETAGLFGDIVFKYVCDNKSKIVLLQNKYKDKPTTFNPQKLISVGCRKKDLNVKINVQSFCDVKKEFIKTDDPVLHNEFDNSSFYLWTNSKVTQENYLVLDQVNNQKIWAVNDEKETKIKKEEKIVKKIFEASKMDTKFALDDTVDFFARFSILFGQPNEFELEELVKKQIALYLEEVTDEDVNNIYDITFGKIKIRCENNNTYLTEEDDFFTECKNTMKLREIVILKMKQIESYDIIYEDMGCLNKIISGSKLLHIETEEKTELLNHIQINQVLSNNKLKNIFLDFSKFKDMHTIVLTAFANDYDVLALVESATVDLKEFDSRLMEIMKIHSDKKVILICRDIQSKMPFVGVKAVSTKLTKLNEKCRKKILRKTQIHFQGKTVRLGNVVLPHLAHALDTESLALIVSKKKTLEVGKKQPALGSVKPFYIRRKLKRDDSLYEPESLLESRNVKNKFIIVVGEPGMGKSTLFSRLVEEYSKKAGATWYYRIDLTKHYREIFHALNISGLKFLRNVCGMDSLEYALFSEYYKKEGNIVLFFDGLDEIYPEYQKTVIRLLNNMNESKVEQIWVATQPYLQEELENEFGTNAYLLEPLPSEEQIIYLRAYGETDDKKTEEILKLSAGVPMHLRMLVKAYELELDTYETDIYDIYERYFFFEYIQQDYDAFNADKLIGYENYAMLTLHEEIAAKFYSSEYEETLKSIPSEVPFSHRIMYDLCVAGCLVRALEQNKKVEAFLFDVNIFHSSQKMMRCFFDLILARDEEIIRAVIRNYIDRVRELRQDVGKLDKKGRTALHLASAHGHLDIVTWLIKQGAAISQPDDLFGWCPITYADANNEYTIINLLLQPYTTQEEIFETAKGIKEMEDGNFSLLHEIIRLRLHKLLKAVLPINPDCVNFTNSADHGKTPMHYAIIYNDLESLTILLETEGCQAKPDKNGCNLFHEAVAHRNIEIVKHVYTYCPNIDINWPNRSGKTPLLLAIENEDIEMMKILTEYGSKLTFEKWRTFLSSEKIKRKLYVFLKEHKNELIDRSIPKYIKSKYCVGLQGIDGDFNILVRLGNCIKSNHVNRVNKLLELQPRLIDQILEESDQQKTNALLENMYHAIMLKDTKMLKLLLSFSDKLVNLYDDANDSFFIFFACKMGALPMISCLVNHGADLGARDKKYGSTCLHHAAAHGHLNAINYLLPLIKDGINQTNNIGNTMLHETAVHGYIHVAAKLIEMGADPYLRDTTGGTFMHTAIKNGSFTMLHRFLEFNPDWVLLNDDSGNNLLHTAILNVVEGDAISLVHDLCEIKPDAMTHNNNGWTPLQFALALNRYEIVDYFLDRDITLIDQKTARGLTLLQHAVNDRNLGLLQYVLKNGADPTLVTQEEKNCLDLAIENNYTEGVEHILIAHPELAKTHIKVSHLVAAVRHDNLDFVKQHAWLDKDDHNLLNELFSVAIELERTEILAFVLQELGNKLVVLDNGLSLLHYAVFKDRKAILEQLLAIDGSWIDYQTELGTTPLHMAALYERRDILIYLLQQGADPKILDVFGSDFYDYASLRDSMVILNYVKKQTTPGRAFRTSDKPKLLDFNDVD